MDSDDVFDRLPDEVVRTIFSKLQDAKSLCSSMAVCKRFHYIVPEVDDICISIPHKKASVKACDQEITHKGLFKNLVMKVLMKPFSLISQMFKFKSKNQENDLDFYSYYVPNEILKSFQEVRSIHLRLPCPVFQNQGSKTCFRNTTFLKWKAEFGKELHSCVILGAKSWSKTPQKEERIECNDQESRVMSDEELKLRIVWTISCLIAASARHYLIKETVKGRKALQELVVSDESDQGRLCMNREQIEEMRELKSNDEMLEYRSRVPALRLKMWYLERLELPDSGGVMEGATVVVIRPAAVDGGGGAEGDGDVVAGAFEGEGEGKVLGEAVRKLMVAKKCYTLEMNSF